MSATSITLAGRAAAEALMVDTCTIVRPSGTHTTDPTTGVVTYGGTPVYAGVCKIQLAGGSVGDRLEQAAERANAVQSAIVAIPTSATGLRVGDIVTVATSTLDPDLVNRVYRVQDMARKSFLTARRLICQEVTG